MTAGKPPIHSTFAADPDMRELVEFFVQEMPGRIASFRKAFDSAAVADLTRLAHQLKGASGGYGFPDIGAKAGAIEAALKSNAGASPHALAAIRADLDELIDLCTRATTSS